MLSFGSNSTGLIIALIPKTHSKLNILDPMTFAIAISVFFLYAAIAEVTSSGNEVPIATIVSPIKASLTPK